MLRVKFIPVNYSQISPDYINYDNKNRTCIVAGFIFNCNFL